MSADLKLYIKGWCPWCIRARQYLNNHHYKFNEIDVNQDRLAYDEMVSLSGQTFTPTLVVDGKILADFGPEDLEVFLKKNNISP